MGLTTPRWGLRYPVGGDAPPDVPLWMSRLASDLDVVAMDDQGTLASRPVSSGGSPGKRGRYYKSTDDNRMWRDYGTGYDEIPLVPIGSDDLLSTDAEKLGLSQTGQIRRGKSIISTAESRTNVAYGLLTTPDRVQNIILPTDGLICIGYHARWQESVAQAGRAAIFVGNNQLRVAAPSANSAPSLEEALTVVGGAANDHLLGTCGLGLASSRAGYSGSVTTGQVVGVGDANGTAAISVGASIGGVTLAQATVDFGICSVFVAAGTYNITVQFKSSSGSVTVADRKLWVWTAGY